MLVVSDFMKGQVEFLSNRSVDVVYNSVNLSIFNVCSDSRIYITSIINFDNLSMSVKRAEIVIRSFIKFAEINTSIKFCLIGKPSSDFDYLMQLIIESGHSSRFIFPGYVDNSIVSEYLKKTLIYVQISEVETFGVSVLEAIASGARVILSNKGALFDNYHNCAKFIPNNSVDVLLHALHSVYISDASYTNENYMLCRDTVISRFSYESRKLKFTQIFQYLGFNQNV